MKKPNFVTLRTKILSVPMFGYTVLGKAFPGSARFSDREISDQIQIRILFLLYE